MSIKKIGMWAWLLTLLLAGPVFAAGGSATVSPEAMQVELSALDLTIIGIYLVGIILLGCWAGIRRRGAQGSDYFLAGRSLGWPVIGLALFATNISTIHLVSFAENGFTSGLTYGNFEWMAPFTLVILSLFFAPFYLRAKVSTLPDFVEKRYNRACRDLLAVISIFSAIMVHIGFSLLTGAIVLEGTILHRFVENPEHYRFFTVLGLCGATAIYTIIGGLLAVVLTESIQTIVLLVGSICITVIGFRMIGGWEGLHQYTHPVSLSIVRPSCDPTGITWYAVFFGYPVLGIWYWCTDQTIVQRVLGARSEHDARLGPLFAGFIKILPVYLFVLPGVICYALVQAGKLPPLPELPDGSPYTKQTYTHMIKHMLWPGMRGVVIAAMLAALMSTVSGALNSIATLFTYDVYSRWRRGASERELVRIGRIATFVAMLVAIAWTMAADTESKVIYQAIVDVFPAVAPPTAVVFIWGVFWRRASAVAATVVLTVGFVGGVIEFILTRMGLIPINALFMSFLLFVAESLLLVVVSWLFPHKHTAESESLVWRNPLAALRGEFHGILDYRIVSLALVAVMVGLYWWFSLPVTHYPVKGQLLLDGRPVIGATVYIDADNDVYDAAIPVDLQGHFEYWSTRQVGGAPAGMKLHLAVQPEKDFIVRTVQKNGQQRLEVLAWVPHGTEIEEKTQDGKRVFLAHLPTGVRRFEFPAEDSVTVLRATEIPPQYRPGNSPLVYTVRQKNNIVEIDLSRPPQNVLLSGA